MSKPERIRLLEAVADAARVVSNMVNDPHPGLATWQEAFSRMNGQLRTALSALAAHRPTQPADTVEVRINYWRVEETGDDLAILERDDNPAEYADAAWRHVAIITARVPAKPPAVPVVEGECA